jgi:ABC-2 type transport system permease protein
MRLYLKYITIHLKSQTQYRLSFLFMILGQFIMSFTVLLGLFFMMNRFHNVDGFTLEQVLLCGAVVLMSFSLAECFFRGFDTFPQMISNGEFDRALTRPRGLIFQVAATRVEFHRLGRFTQSILVFCYSIPASGVSWTIDKIITLALMVICGFLVFSGLFILYAGVTFFTIDGIEFMNILTDGGREFGAYPYSIYGENILRFLTYVVPLALFQYYPFLYILGLRQSKIYMLYPPLGLLFLIPAYAFWRFGLSRYKSTGS